MRLPLKITLLALLTTLFLTACIHRTAFGAKKIYAPVWHSLADRLAKDGVSGSEVDQLLATLASKPSQSPMGRKIRELYLKKFYPKPPKTEQDLYYKGVVTSKNAVTCQQFINSNRAVFRELQRRYSIPANIATALLFVETRLGTVLGDVPENAFYTLASMSICRKPQDIAEWLPKMPDSSKHLDWIAENMPARADWAYRETRALVKYMLMEKIRPEQLPGSIYGAIGICQFMPSNISVYGADGDNDGHINLFTVADAVASMGNYLAKHGWKAGLSREQQHKILMTYNHSQTYANTILALADLVEQSHE